MRIVAKKTSAGALAIALAATVSACGGMPENRSLNSVHQPIVERTNYTFDVNAGSQGLTIPEQQRLNGWFDAMELQYGDRVAIDDPSASPATRDAVAELAARRGILVSEGAPVTAGMVEPGRARVVVTRSSATVPGCPDWSASSDANYNNAVSSNYGCATNSNLAAMVANPEDLITGQRGTGETVVVTSIKAIDSYRRQPPTGEDGLTENATSSGSGGE